ncbi:MAG: MATE family efflux transporter [Clostridia bacterium]|nr:MATE family efflux transporter [Clostridia bacterium]
MKYIGDRQFYKRVLALLIPILVQTGITNFVNMLDNLMIGRTGSSEIAGVAVGNQLLFVLNLCVFGMVSGAGILGAQYFGKKDREGFQNILRFKLIAVVLLTAGATALFLGAGEFLVSRFINEEDPEVRAAAIGYARTYLFINLIGLLPYCFSQAFASSLRETGKSVMPMVAGLCAVAVNLSLNYILIFGKFGAPKLGVKGAAIATVVSRFAEFAVIAISLLARRRQHPYIMGTLRTLRVPGQLVKLILTKSLPLVFNETMWALGMTVVARQYSLRGLATVTAYNIENTVFNLFFVTFAALGSAGGIIVGQHLGAGDMDGAKSDSYRLLGLTVVLGILVSAAFTALSGVIPKLYNIEPEVRTLAARLMLICALTMTIEAIVNELYFILRSGGKMSVTIIFDSGFTWAVLVPTVAILVRFTPLAVPLIYLVDRLLTIIKTVLGAVIFRRGKWMRQL